MRRPVVFLVVAVLVLAAAQLIWLTRGRGTIDLPATGGTTSATRAPGTHAAPATPLARKAPDSSGNPAGTRSPAQPQSAGTDSRAITERQLRDYLAALQGFDSPNYSDVRAWFAAQGLLDALLGSEEGVEALAAWLGDASAAQLRQTITFLTWECENPPECTGYARHYYEQLSIPPQIEDALLRIIASDGLTARSLQVLGHFSPGNGAAPAPVVELALAAIEQHSTAAIPPDALSLAVSILTNPLPDGFREANSLRLADLTRYFLEIADQNPGFAMYIGKLPDPAVGTYLLDGLARGTKEADELSSCRSLHGIMFRLRLDDERLPAEARATFEHQLVDRLRDLHVRGDATMPAGDQLQSTLWALAEMRDHQLANVLLLDLADRAQVPGQSEVLRELASRILAGADRNSIMQYIFENTER